jgi:Putative Flp pilus-assembly TadE/G-like
MAIMLIVLLGAAGLTVDLGWLYWNSLEIQHGADTAALAGVVYEPDQRSEAHTVGVAAAVENGFVHDPVSGNTIELVDFSDDPTAVHNGSQLRATITQEVPTLFLGIFGLDSVGISRTALAEYVQPLALGSPESSFGNDPETGFDPNLWASIHGTYGPQSWGDRYTALCVGTSTYGPSCTPTADGRPSVDPGLSTATGGYLYGIEVEPGATGLSVEIFDGPFYAGGTPYQWTGDFGLSSPDPMATTWFMLYGPDVTPLDTTDGNELLCVVKYEARSSRADDFSFWNSGWTSFDDISKGELAQMWDSMASSGDQTMCASDFDRGPGIYPLRVMIEHNDSWWTTNKYSLRTSVTSGPAPMIYGLGDMSIYNNVDLGLTEFYLARIEEVHAGKTLVVEFWDAGDVENGGVDDTLTIRNGAGGVPADCTWAASNGDSGSNCIINVSAKRYDNELISVYIPIAEDYTCTGDECWYRVEYDYTGSDVHDTTSWTAYITGNPIRLVE